MSFDVLLQVLRSFESFAAKVTFVRLERNVNTNMRSDMIALHGGCSAVAPLTRQVEIICALAANMPVTNMILNIESVIRCKLK